jgi:hypothetical protein
MKKKHQSNFVNPMEQVKEFSFYNTHNNHASNSMKNTTAEFNQIKLEASNQKEKADRMYNY